MKFKRLNMVLLGLLLSASCKSTNVSDSNIQRFEPENASEDAFVTAIDNDGLTEYCIRIGGYPELGPKWEKKMFDDKKQRKLCDIKFDSQNPNQAICPKSHSTNPAVEIMDISELVSSGVATRSSYQNMRGYGKGCGIKQGRDGKKLVKFKSTVTCSSTAAIVSGYYIGKLLDIGNVPPVVLRTVRKSVMQEVTNRGLTTGMATSWKSWNSILKGTAKKELLDLNLTADGRFVYGALSKNPGGEHKHSNNVRPIRNFVKKSSVRKAFGQSSISMEPNSLEAFAEIKEANDMSGMIIFDTLLDQQDRLGNIHAKDAYYAVKNGEVEKFRKAPTDLGAVVRAERLLLKDNDCGLRGDSVNIVKEGLYKRIRHLSPKTYSRLRWLAIEVKSGRMAKFIKAHSMRDDGRTARARWGKTVIKAISSGVKSMESRFYASCKSGDLKLDLDANDVFKNGQPSAAELRQRCDLVWDPKNDQNTRLASSVFASNSIDIGGGSPSASGPNKCRTRSGTSGLCIDKAECLASGKRTQSRRCLNDPGNVLCCF